MKSSVVITKRLRDQLLKIEKEEDFWERLSDITEHPPEWLKKLWPKSTAVRYEVVKETEDYGTVLNVPAGV